MKTIMPETNLEFIRKKVIEAVPEIMSSEAKEGGYASFADENIPHLVLRVAPTFGRKAIMVTMQGFGGDFNITLLKPSYRPIRLADVLLAIEGKYRHGDKVDIRVFPSGTFEKLYMGDILPGEWEFGCKWNLRNDDLNSQSEETLTFIASLLR